MTKCNHQTRCGEWGNVIGHETSSAAIEVYAASKTSPVENFMRALKNDMVVNMPTLFVREGEGGGPPEVKFLGATSNPRRRNMASEEFQLEAFLKSSFYLVQQTKRCVK